MGTRELDSTDIRFRLRSVYVGIALSAVTVAFVAAYAAMTWERPHRAALVAMMSACLAGSLAIRALPLERLLRSRRREGCFLVWSVSIVAVIVVAAVLDDGAHSPIAMALFLPLIYSALSYPLRSMIAVGVVVLCGYLVVVVSTGSSLPTAFFVACCLGAAAAMCSWQARIHDRWRAELARVSRSDPLTGCLNRRGLEERYDRELARAGRRRGPFAMVLLDLDGFKQVNDADGHAAGDDLLTWVVQRIGDVVRPPDAVGRLGGDEFAVLLPDTTPDDGDDIARRVREAIAPRVGVSTGVAHFPADGTERDVLSACADARMYAAKSRGRAISAEPAAPPETGWAAAEPVRAA